jgi:hypothetical protein
MTWHVILVRKCLQLTKSSIWHSRVHESPYIDTWTQRSYETDVCTLLRPVHCNTRPLVQPVLTRVTTQYGPRHSMHVTANTASSCLLRKASLLYLTTDGCHFLPVRIKRGLLGRPPTHCGRAVGCDKDSCQTNYGPTTHRTNNVLYLKNNNRYLKKHCNVVN